MTVHGRGQGCGVDKKSCFIVQTEADDIICKDCEVTYQVSYMQYSISIFVQTGEHTSLRLLINFCQNQHSCKFRYGICILLSSCNVHASQIAYDMLLLLLRGLKQFVAHQNVLV